MDRHVAALLAMTHLCSDWLNRRFDENCNSNHSAHQQRRSQRGGSDGRGDDFSLAYEEPRLPLPPRGFSKKANACTPTICDSLPPRGFSKKANVYTLSICNSPPPRGFSKKANVYTLSICNSPPPRGFSGEAIN